MLGRFTKQPGEAYVVSIDFSPRLGTSETVASTAAVATQVSTGTTVTSTVLTTASITETEGEVLLPVKAGTDGEDYKIRVRVTTTGGTIAATHEADLLMRVREEG